MKLFLPLLALTILTTLSRAEETGNASTSSTDLNLQPLARSAAQTLWKGTSELDRNEEGAISLLDLVKTLSAHGVGKPSTSTPSHRHHHHAHQGREDQKASRSSNRRKRGSRLAKLDLEFLKALDPNRDGLVTKAEALQACEHTLTQALESKMALDANGDGLISAREYALTSPDSTTPKDADGLTEHRRHHFQREDLNEDGMISRTEIITRSHQFLAKRADLFQLTLRLTSRDLNSDATYTAEELKDTLPAWTQDAQSLPASEIYSQLQALEEPSLQDLDRALSIPPSQRQKNHSW